MKKHPILRNLLTVLFIAGIAVLLSLAAKYGNKLVESILSGGIQNLLIIFATAIVIAIILGIVETITNSGERRNGNGGGRHTDD